MKLFLLTAIFMALCFLALGIRVWIRGEFAETEISRNKNMRKLGITCVKEEEMKLHGAENQHADGGCSACAFLSKCDKL